MFASFICGHSHLVRHCQEIATVIPIHKHGQITTFTVICAWKIKMNVKMF